MTARAESLPGEFGVVVVDKWITLPVFGCGVEGTDERDCDIDLGDACLIFFVQCGNGHE